MRTSLVLGNTCLYVIKRIAHDLASTVSVTTRYSDVAGTNQVTDYVTMILFNCHENCGLGTRQRP